MPRVVCLSDTHGQHQLLSGPLAVPDGDLLIHAGDCTGRDRLPEHLAFLDWFAALPHPHKVLVAGNHDGAWAGAATRGALEAEAARRGVAYLQDGAGVFAGLRVYGSPWTPEFYDWHFMYPRGGERAEWLWGGVHEGLDVLVTHGPAHGVRDRTTSGHLAGCELLWRRLYGSGDYGLRRPPRLHVFGHIHEGAGQTRMAETLAVNASVVDVRYAVVHAPTVVDL